METDREVDRGVAALVQELASSGTEQQTLQAVVDQAVRSVPGCRWAGVTVRAGRRLETPAATDPLVVRVDELQYELREGPCVDAVWADDTYLIDDMAQETRWPRWCPGALELGVRSVLSVRLSAHDQLVGGLNLYAPETHAFDDDDVQIAHSYADNAASVLTVSNRVEGLRTALQTRHSIGLAQGVLVHRHELTVDQSFAVLVRVSRDNNVKLRDLAALVVEHRGLPPEMVRSER